MLSAATERLQGLARGWSRRSRRERTIQILALVGGIVLFAAIASLRGTDFALKLVGYPGVFIISVIGSSSLVLPLPAVASTCGMSVLLSPALVGVISAIGETLGELTGYAVGYGSQEFFQRRRFYRWVRKWMNRRGTIILLIVSAIPNPIFDIIGISAGATRFPLARFIVTVGIGKTIKGIAIAYGCHFGWNQLPWGT